MKSILIVDDSPIIRHSLRVLLEQEYKWEVCGEAENGLEGVEKAAQLCPDLILLDLSMPVMNGFQAARELRRLLPRIPILMFTNFNSPYIEKEALASGVNAVKSKSDGAESLCGSIQALFSAT